MQNMKLLDLQTGKYLELGKDFYYGGDTITCPPVKSFITKGTGQCLDIYADNVDMYDINEIIDGSTDDDIKCGTSEFEITLKSNNQKFVGVPVGNIDDRFNRIFYKTEPQEPLKTLCEKTDAVVYGGRYVLLNEIDVWVYNNDLPPKKIQTGDVIKQRTSYVHTKHNLINVLDFFLDTSENIKTTHKIGKKTFSKFDFFAIDKILGNPFEEYSKQLRNEPNKFEELMELIK